MQKVKIISAKIVSSIAIVAALTGVGMLYTPNAGAVNCAILPDSICGNANSTPQNGIITLLKWVLKMMIALVGVAAVGGVLWAGVLYLTAGDDTGKTKQAKTIIVDVAIGIIAFALMFLVLNWLIPGGVLS